MFIVLAILLQLAGVWTLFLSSRETTIGTALAYQRQRMDDNVGALSDALRRKEEAALELAYDSQVRTYLKATHAKRYETYELVTKLMANALMDDMLIAARLAFTDGTGLNCGNYGAIPSLPINAGEPFWLPYYEAPAKYARTGAQSSAPSYYLLYRVPILDPTYHMETAFRGALILVYDLSKLMDVAYGGAPWALYAQGDILLGSQGFPEKEACAALTGGEAVFPVSDRQWHLLTAQNASLSAEIVMLFEEHALSEGVGELLRWALLISTIIILCSVVVAVALYRSLLAPVATVVKQLEAIGRRTGDALPVADSSCRELNTLTREINDMIKRLHAHAERELQMQQALYQADMQRIAERTMYLQSQINPHFLYNNLECMRGMAALGDGKAVRTMCTAMAEVYRYGTRGRQLTVTLRDEMTCLKRYCEIVRLRFGEQYRLVDDVKNEFLPTPIPRMTLQPLAENAVLHGLAPADLGEAIIHITVREKDGRVQLLMEDNGAGMDAEALKAINEELQNSKSGDLMTLDSDRVGVINIHCRLKMLLGGECGLRFEAREQGGLRAVVTLGEIDMQK